MDNPTSPLSDKDTGKKQFIAILAVLFIASIGVISATMILLSSALQHVENTALDIRAKAVDDAEDASEDFIDDTIDAMIEVKDALRKGEESKEAILEGLLQSHVELEDASLTDVDFDEYLKVNRLGVSPGEELVAYKEEDFLDTDLGFYISQPVVSEDRSPFVAIAMPLRAEENTGFVMARLDLSDLSDILTDFQISPLGRVYMVDLAGKAIIAADDSLVPGTKVAHGEDLVRELGEDEEFGLLEYTNENGIDTDASGFLMEEYGWVVIVEQPSSEVDMLKQRTVLLAVILLAIGLVLLSLLLYENIRIIAVNKKLGISFLELSQLNKESDETAKMLVRRDVELTLSNERLQEIDETKSQFVSVAAHQLRTPLSGIKWTLDTLLEKEIGGLNEEQEKLIGDAYKANDRLIELIRDLLDVARLEEGRFGFEMKKEDFLPVVKDVKKKFEQAAEQKGIAFKLELPQKDLERLLIDKEKIAIALENFVDNAIKYTPPGGEVIIRVIKEKDKIVAEIKDTGIGIPKKEITKLFNKFFRATNAQLFQTNGTGLGMYLARNIIEHHGGTVYVESEEHKGTTLSFSIPIR